MDPQATAGRIVHYYYVNPDTGKFEGPRAAVICEDTPPDGTAEIQVFGTRPPHGGYPGVRYSESPKAACWSWMPYQRAKAETERGNVSESAEPPSAEGQAARDDLHAGSPFELVDDAPEPLERTGGNGPPKVV
ncbi:hypothetical protein LCGC14_2672520 [marine sediment metagenome]|uniref:Uncharacterized protein n=1 Tax=marine sediment metagenome TaxID=412755 RepID=A0A0F8ZNN0_9ZZZZ